VAKGRAKLAIAEGVSVWVLEAPDGFGDASFHRHHAIQLTVALAGALQLDTDDASLSAPAIAVAADARHRFEARGLLAFVFVEPESLHGRTLTRTIFRGRDLVALDADDAHRHLEPLRAAFDADLDQSALLAAGRAFVDALAGHLQAPLPDDRVRRIIDSAKGRLDGPLSLAAAAQGIYLSESRLRHLFVEQTGLPFKTYLLWLRLMRAVQLYSGGETLTHAALSAGFADSAHFSRIFRRTFGLPATTLTRF
jgi:AraC-like DNA-binding protein